MHCCTAVTKVAEYKKLNLETSFVWFFLYLSSEPFSNSFRQTFWLRRILDLDSKCTCLTAHSVYTLFLQEIARSSVLEIGWKLRKIVLDWLYAHFPTKEDDTIESRDHKSQTCLELINRGDVKVSTIYTNFLFLFRENIEFLQSFFCQDSYKY
jgi:hypothetical protein